MRAATIGFVLLAAIGTAGAQSQEILIMGGQSQDEFLGCLTCSEYDSSSVWSQYGRYSFQNGYGVWNKYGQHANRYSTYSACNQYSTNAPALVDRAGNFYGRLSVNRYASDSVCGPSGNQQICTALRVMCAED